MKVPYKIAERARLLKMKYLLPQYPIMEFQELVDQVWEASDNYWSR